MTNEMTNLGAAGRSTGAISVVGILQNEDAIVRLIDAIAAPNRATNVPCNAQPS